MQSNETENSDISDEIILPDNTLQILNSVATTNEEKICQYLLEHSGDLNNSNKYVSLKIFTEYIMERAHIASKEKGVIKYLENCKIFNDEFKLKLQEMSNGAIKFKICDVSENCLVIYSICKNGMSDKIKAISYNGMDPKFLVEDLTRYIKKILHCPVIVDKSLRVTIWHKLFKRNK